MFVGPLPLPQDFFIIRFLTSQLSRSPPLIGKKPFLCPLSLEGAPSPPLLSPRGKWDLEVGDPLSRGIAFPLRLLQCSDNNFKRICSHGSFFSFPLVLLTRSPASFFFFDGSHSRGSCSPPCLLQSFLVFPQYSLPPLCFF